MRHFKPQGWFKCTSRIDCGSSFLALVWWAMYPVRRLLFAVPVLAFALSCVGRTAWAASFGTGKEAQHSGAHANVACPPREQIERTLGEASTLLEQKQYGQAAQLLETLTATRCEPVSFLLLAAAFEASGDMAKAESTLQTAHAIWPASTSIATSLARENLKEKKIDKALSALKRLHVAQTMPPQEMQVAILVYLAAHKLTEAQSVADTAYNLHPSLNSLLLLANVLQLEGRYKTVNQLLEKQRKTYADSAPFLITFAESEFDAMLYDAARADLEQAIALDANSYQAHYLLGNVLVAQNLPDQAESEYRKAISLAPDQPRTYYHLALLLHSRQDDADEEPLLKQALAADAHYAAAYCELGRLQLDRHQLADAVTQLNLAIQFNPELEQAYYLLARAYSGLGQKEKADAMVKRYKALREANRHGVVDAHPDQIENSMAQPE